MIAEIIKELERLDYFIDDVSGSRNRLEFTSSADVQEVLVNMRLWSSAFEGDRLKSDDGRYEESIKDYVLRMVEQQAGLLIEAVRLVKQQDKDEQAAIERARNRP